MGEISNRCLECGTEYQSGQEHCPACNAALNPVRVMTLNEREQFDGMTIEQDDNSGKYGQYDKAGTKSRVYVRQVKFSSGGMGLITKLLIGAGLVALIMLVALPVMLVFLAAAVFGWLVFRRR